MSLQKIREKEDGLKSQLQEVSKRRLELELAEDVEYREQFDKILLDELRQNHVLLNLLAPDHERTSCSDADPCNPTKLGGRVDCVRCSLLYWLEHPETLPDSFRLEFRVNVMRREQQ